MNVPVSPAHVPAVGDWLQRAGAVITSGGVVALAFEQLFGLAADALNPTAVARSAAIKDRPTHEMGAKPISVILPSIHLAHLVCDGFSERAKALAEKYWPGPLTMLVKAKTSIPLPLIGPGGLIGVRVPGPSPAYDLVQHLQTALTATSANRKGEVEPLRSSELIALEGVDMVIEGAVLGPPGSTIVIVDGSEMKILRQGVLQLSDGVL